MIIKRIDEIRLKVKVDWDYDPTGDLLSNFNPTIERDLLGWEYVTYILRFESKEQLDTFMTQYAKQNP